MNTLSTSPHCDAGPTSGVWGAAALPGELPLPVSQAGLALCALGDGTALPAHKFASPPLWDPLGDLRGDLRVHSDPERSSRIPGVAWHPLARQLVSVLEGTAQAPDRFWAIPEGAFVGGQLSFAADVWTEFIIPMSGVSPRVAKEVSHWVQSGVDIPSFMHDYKGDEPEWFDTCEPPSMRFNNHPWDSTLSGFVTTEVARLVDTGCVTETQSQPYLCMALGVEPKKPRLIADDRPLNAWTESPSFRMDRLRDFARGLDDGDFMFSVDHKSGYHHLAMSPSCQRWFGFELQGRFYYYNVLPFGWSPSCYVYQTLSNVLTAFLRRFGIHVLAYLDDFAVALRLRWTSQRRYDVRWSVLALMCLAGYCVAWPKTVVVPTVRLPMLGFIVDSVERTFRVPKAKLDARLDDLRELQAGTGVSFVALRSLTGKLMHLSLALPPMALYLRSFYDVLAAGEGHMSANARGDFRVEVSADMVADIADMLVLLERHGDTSGSPLLVRWLDEHRVQVRIDTDASSAAWGAALYMPSGSVLVNGDFPPELFSEHITYKELYAVVAGIETLRARGGAVEAALTSSFVDVHTDNTVTESVLLKFSTKSSSMRPLVRRLASLQLDAGLVFRVFRVTSADNQVADHLSRFVPVLYADSHLDEAGIDRSDHMLRPEYFDEVQEWAQETFTLDVCASPDNRQTQRYVARQYIPSDPDCVAGNVLAYHFPFAAREFLFVNPPWVIMGPVWRHLRLSRTCGVVIFPERPDEPWFPWLIEDCLEVAFLADTGDVVFNHPSLDFRDSVGPVPWPVLMGYFDFRD